MAKMSVQGLYEYALRLSNLSKNTEQIVRQAVYEGAGVVADSIKSGLRQIPVDNGRGTEDRKLHGVTNRQKADLIDAFGLAPIENRDDYIQTKAGFSGYGTGWKRRIGFLYKVRRIGGRRGRNAIGVKAADLCKI